MYWQGMCTNYFLTRLMDRLLINLRSELGGRMPRLSTLWRISFPWPLMLRLLPNSRYLAPKKLLYCPSFSLDYCKFSAFLLLKRRGTKSYIEPIVSATDLGPGNSVVGATIAQLVVFLEIFSFSDPTKTSWVPVVLNQVTLALSTTTACAPYLKPFMESLESGVVRVENLDGSQEELSRNMGLSGFGGSGSYSLRDTKRSSVAVSHSGKWGWRKSIFHLDIYFYFCSSSFELYIDRGFDTTLFLSRTTYSSSS